MPPERPNPDLTGPELFALVWIETFGFRPKRWKRAYRSILGKGLVGDGGQLTDPGARWLFEMTSQQPGLLAQVRRQALIEGLRLYGPTQEALVMLAGFSAAAGIGHTEAIHAKVQHALLQRALLGPDGELTLLGRKAAEAVLKEKYLRRR